MADIEGEGREDQDRFGTDTWLGFLQMLSQYVWRERSIAEERLLRLEDLGTKLKVLEQNEATK
jgi:hypothetical protein